MKSFKSVVVVKHPHSLISSVMRDHLSDFAHNVTDIDSVTERERTWEQEDIVRIINEWKVRYHIPSAVKGLIGDSELGWLDYNHWQGHICSWSIEPFFLAGQISCRGETSFEPAMAGQGARVTLEGSFEIRHGFMKGAAALIEGPVLRFAETIVTTVLPKNLRAVIEAAASYVRASTQ
jgi:hypothetical protein